nr:MAG TPA: hypothetical protein [Bacteriophage sp.]
MQNGGLKNQKCTKISKYCAKSHISRGKTSQKLQKGEFL